VGLDLPQQEHLARLFLRGSMVTLMSLFSHNDAFYTQILRKRPMFVLMCLLTTAMCGPLLNWSLKKNPSEN
jgi:hypothetical protein